MPYDNLVRCTSEIEWREHKGAITEPTTPTLDYTSTSVLLVIASRSTRYNDRDFLGETLVTDN